MKKTLVNKQMKDIIEVMDNCVISMKKKVIVVIPAYEPDEKMLALVQELKQKTSFHIVIVDDGSGEKYAALFEQAKKYADVLSYESNEGKGYALKYAFAYILKKYGQGVSIVTADADGQHKRSDIQAVVQIALDKPEYLVLGSREFTGNVPARSKFGNTVTCQVFHLLAGVKLKDTQTGLRAFDGKYISYMLALDGNRYEYEMNMLSKWARDKKAFYEYVIETVYIDDNKGSHFHPIKDSFKIYKEMILFSCSSFIGFCVDYVCYTVLSLLTGGLSTALSAGVSNIGARVISATVNYNINRKIVFKSDEKIAKTAAQYALLAVGILVLNTVLLEIFVNTIIPNSYIAKILVEILLFFFSCFVQKKIIFKKKVDKETC